MKVEIKKVNGRHPIQFVKNSDEFLIEKMNKALSQPRDKNGRFISAGTQTRTHKTEEEPYIPDFKTKEPNTVYEHFIQICDGLKELYAKKNKDYGNAWQKHLYKYGLRPFTMRVSEKIDRIDSIIDNGGAQVKDESIMDTMLDIAAYAIMTAAEIKADKDKKILGKLA